MIYVVFGPTASKKSDLAIKLKERLTNSYIVNFDSFQVYKELDKGSAKPVKEELAKGYYLLYDFLPLSENNDVATFQELGRNVIKNYIKDNDLIFVGGTGLYIKAILFNYIFDKEEVKMPLDYKKDKTNLDLYNELLTLDKEDALKIGINNRKRLLRSLFINEVHNKSKSEINNNKKDELLYNDVKFIYIKPDREILYETINKRVDKMIESGLIDEVKYLFKKYDKSSNGLKAIGYKEFIPYLENKVSIEETIELIKKNTRNYAKRQYTFFNNQFNSVKDKTLVYKDVNEALIDLDNIIK